MRNIAEQLNKQREFVRSKQLMNVDLRKKYLQSLKDTIEKYRESIIEAVDFDLGRNRFKTTYVEVNKVVDEIDYCLAKLQRWVKPKRVGTPLLFFPAKSYVFHEPYGHCLVIAPWNYPVNLALIPAICAIAAGNSVCIKPSEISAATSKIICKLIAEALPTEVAICVEGAVEETTFLLDQKFDHIFYTGNGAVGRIIMEKAAKHLTPVVLELGGKSPVLMDTKNLNVAAKRLVFAKFFNCGQTCIAPDYVLIKKEDKAKFVAYCDKWIKYFFSDPKNCDDYGRIISQRHFDRLEGLLEGSEILVDRGRDRETRYFGPTLVSATAESKVMQEEIFGPILPLVEVESLEQGIDFVNQRDKPLACYGFVDSKSQSDLLIRSISAGGMVINDALLHFTNSHLPFGGVGESGMGSYHGNYSFDTFSHKKAVMTTNFVFENDLRYPPYAKKASWLLKLARLLG